MDRAKGNSKIGILFILVLVIAISVAFAYFNANYTFSIVIEPKNKNVESLSNHHTQSFDFQNENIRDYVDIDISKANDYEKKEHDDDELIGNNLKKHCKILFAGDTYIAPNVAREYTNGGGIYSIIDDEFIKAIDENDFFVANLETPITERETFDRDKQYCFKQSPDELHILDSLGVDLFATANNHTFDFGEDALSDTWQYMDYIGIHTFGSGKNRDEAFKPFIININGVRVAFFNATTVVPKESWKATDTKKGLAFLKNAHTEITPTIKELKNNNLIDKAIVFMHWGKELEEKPNEAQIDAAHSLIRGGADFVIGAHPHIPQTIEFYEGKPIVYSLGNFIFGKNIIKQMALVQIEFDITEDDCKLKIIPGTGWWNSLKAYAYEEKDDALNSYIASSDNKLKFDKDGYVTEVTGLESMSIDQLEEMLVEDEEVPISYEEAKIETETKAEMKTKTETETDTNTLQSEKEIVLPTKSFPTSKDAPPVEIVKDFERMISPENGTGEIIDYSDRVKPADYDVDFGPTFD